MSSPLENHQHRHKPLIQTQRSTTMLPTQSAAPTDPIPPNTIYASSRLPPPVSILDSGRSRLAPRPCHCDTSSAAAGNYFRRATVADGALAHVTGGASWALSVGGGEKGGLADGTVRGDGCRCRWTVGSKMWVGLLLCACARTGLFGPRSRVRCRFAHAYPADQGLRPMIAFTSDLPTYLPAGPVFGAQRGSRRSAGEDARNASKRCSVSSPRGACRTMDRLLCSTVCRVLALSSGFFGCELAGLRCDYGEGVGDGFCV